MRIFISRTWIIRYLVYEWHLLCCREEGSVKRLVTLHSIVTQPQECPSSRSTEKPASGKDCLLRFLYSYWFLYKLVSIHCRILFLFVNQIVKEFMHMMGPGMLQYVLILQQSNFLATSAILGYLLQFRLSFQLFTSLECRRSWWDAKWWVTMTNCSSLLCKTCINYVYKVHSRFENKKYFELEEDYVIM
jgi:hypothetical protein